MSCIIHIETSTRACSVALSEDGQVLYDRTEYDGPSHAALLGCFVEDVMSFADSHAMKLDAVAISEGPGSYTGLRIGASMAKGLCYGRGLKLLGVSTLQLLCVPVLLGENLPDDALLCPLLDARRMEVYTAVYNRALQAKESVQAKIVDAEFLKEYSIEHPVYLFGNGAEKCKQLLSSNKNVHFIDGVIPLAKNMLPLAEKAMAMGEWKDVAYFEPFYLKDFVASQPKKIF